MSENLEQEGNAAPKPGPTEVGGEDVPTPPGGPQRQDVPDTDEVPQPENRDVRPAAPTDPAPEDVVEENAETAMHQPSDGES